MKDEKIKNLLVNNNLNIAEFVSIHNGLIRHNCTNSKFKSFGLIVEDLIKRKGSVNVRSFSSDNQKQIY